MLTQLDIQGMALIDRLKIEFSPGFNVITGETGAGKSILIRSLAFLLGAKADAETVRQGHEMASVVGHFLVPEGHDIVGVLERLQIPTEVEASQVPLLIRRQLNNKGRSAAWVNDVPVTNSSLRELGATLVDVFAQHENQRLMDPNSHLRYVDEFLSEKTILTEYRVLFQKANQEIADAQSTLEAFHSNLRNRDYLAFRLEELTQFAPSREDFVATQELCERVESQSVIAEGIGEALRFFEETEEQATPAQLLREAAKAIQKLESSSVGALAERFRVWKERIHSAALEIDEIGFELAKEVSEEMADGETLEKAQSRLFGYQDLFRKLNVRDVDGLMDEMVRLQNEITFLTSAQETLTSGLNRLLDLSEDLQTRAKKISDLRAKASLEVKRRVEIELQDLAMPGARIEVVFQPVLRDLPDLDFTPFDEGLQLSWQSVKAILCGLSDKGKERAQMLLSANPGEPMHMLSKVASGGELSRMMLAFKKALAADADTCVLVFDEIDTGISGRVADVVGKKMRSLADGFQVLCISHLPQVAVYADVHFQVRKVGKASRTETSIVRMSEDESAEEIARLLSGAEVSKASLENARALIAKAKREGRLVKSATSKSSEKTAMKTAAKSVRKGPKSSEKRP